jgi:phosphoglycolate phosphatase
MKYTHIVWDFNGTIIDDVGIGIQSVNPLLEKRGLKPIESLDEYKKLFDFPIIDYYRRLGFDFEKEPYEKIAVEWVENYKALSDEIPLVDGVLKALESIGNLGLKNLILSASERDMLEDKLTKLGIIEKFECLLALDNIYAHSKLDIAREYFADKDKSKYLMVGDTVHDFDVARKVGIDVVLVACGHQSYDKLVSTGCVVFGNMNGFKDFLEGM